MPEAVFMRHGSTAAASWDDAMAAQSARGLLQDHQLPMAKDQDEPVPTPCPDLSPAADSSVAMTKQSEATSAERDVCPQRLQCDRTTDKSCTPLPARPRTWAGVCPESMPYLLVGCIVGVAILVCGVCHLMKARRSVSHCPRSPRWAELLSTGFWSFVYLVHGNVWA